VKRPTDPLAVRLYGRALVLLPPHFRREYGPAMLAMVSDEWRVRRGATRVTLLLRVVLDLLTVKYMLDYFTSPMKLFGMIGLSCGGVAMLACLATLVMKSAAAVDISGNPFSLLALLASLAAIQFFSLGLLGEVNARIYYASQPKQNFAIRELVNFDRGSQGSNQLQSLPIRRAA